MTKINDYYLKSKYYNITAYSECKREYVEKYGTEEDIQELNKFDQELDRLYP